jgi:dTMP kinase
MKGLFITLEGPDGSGKTTQAEALVAYLRKKGLQVVMTREPGGTVISEQIRNILLDKKNQMMDNMTEALLYAASRAQHVAEVIQPALKEGKIVICDRFLDSSIVYQGIGRGLGLEMVQKINEFAVRGCMPDITFLLKLPPRAGLERKYDQGDGDRLENESIYFHEQVYRGYQLLEEQEPERIKGIDARKTPEEIHLEIVRCVENKLKGREKS